MKFPHCNYWIQMELFLNQTTCGNDDYLSKYFSRLAHFCYCGKIICRTHYRHSMELTVWNLSHRKQQTAASRYAFKVLDSRCIVFPLDSVSATQNTRIHTDTHTHSGKTRGRKGESEGNQRQQGYSLWFCACERGVWLFLVACWRIFYSQTT